MSHYKQLTCEQRYQIYVLMQVQQTQNEIARMVGVHTSTSAGKYAAIVDGGDIVQNRHIAWS